MNSQNILRQSAPSGIKLAALLMTATFLATTLMPPSVASAEQRRHVKRHHNQHHVRNYRRPNRHYHYNSAGNIIAGSIIGLTVGAIAESSARWRYDHYYSRDYYGPTYADPAYPIYDGPYEYDREPRPYAAREPGPSRGYAPREPRPDRIRTGKVLDAPKVITYEESASLEPWSDSWISYCRTKYRSFNPKSGTFLGYDGDRHFCVAK